jgi:hypothetical protein
LYFNTLAVFESRSPVLLSKFPSHFVEDLLRRTEIPRTNYNIVTRKARSKGGDDSPPGEETASA